MKTIRDILVPAAMAALSSTQVATHTVLPGQSIQAKIDAAAAGDIVAIFGGTYPDDVTINKAIRLTEVDGEEVTLTGNVTWNGVTNAPAFEGFTVGSPDKGITVNNTTNFVLKNIDARAGFGVKVNGNSTVGIVEGHYSKIEQDGGELTVSKAQTTGNFETTANSQKTVAFRVNSTGDYQWNTKYTWVGYCSAWHFGFGGSGCKVVIIGTKFDAQNRAINGIQLEGSNNSFLVVNASVINVFHGMDWYNNNSFDQGYRNYPGRGIYLGGSGNTASIFNNYISMNWSGHYDADNDAGEGIRSMGNTGIKIYNNIVEGARYGIKAPFGADCRNQFYYNLVSSWEVGGCVPIESSGGDPLFVSGQKPALQPSSPCVNAGMSDPIYNDLDGTRNDIGPSGGSLYDPDGWTTDNPVVISFDLAPQQLLKGVDTQITLSDGQAVTGSN